MHIKTKDNKIMNFSHYRGVEVFGRADDNYVLRAILPVGLENKTKYDPIGTFNTHVDAGYALYDLFRTIADGKSAWDVNTVRILSEVWCKCKADNPSMALLDKMKLIEVSNLGELIIAYPAIHKGTKGLEDKLGVVYETLTKALCEKIQVKWETDDDSDR